MTDYFTGTTPSRKVQTEITDEIFIKSWKVAEPLQHLHEEVA